MRAEIGILLAENKKLRGENLLLKKISSGKIVIDQRPCIKNNSEVGVLPDIKLTPQEIESLTHAISTETIDQQNWKVLSRGGVKTTTGQQLYKNGYVSAIKKILLVAR